MQIAFGVAFGDVGFAHPIYKREVSPKTTAA
jgi:hypothetical protein